VATSDVVKFYVNGALVATNTTNIPTTSLNALFLISASTLANINVQNVEFEQWPK
jgi:hypothetical protein